MQGGPVTLHAETCLGTPQCGWGQVKGVTLAPVQPQMPRKPLCWLTQPPLPGAHRLAHGVHAFEKIQPGNLRLPPPSARYHLFLRPSNARQEAETWAAGGHTIWFQSH